MITLTSEEPHSPAAPDSDVHGEQRRKGVLIVDDHPVLRHGIAQLINKERDLVAYFLELKSRARRR